MKPAYTVDFETEKIGQRPFYPPRPVGVAVRFLDGMKRYYAWGHPTENNCTAAQARAVLYDVFTEGVPVIFHNSGFDLDIAQTFFRLPWPRYVEDTLYLAFLKNPYELDLNLKVLTEKHCGVHHGARDELRDWIFEHVPESRRAKTKWGEHISKAPGRLAGKYAKQDVGDAYLLWRTFRPEIYDRGMGAAYNRELALTRITLEMERSGVRVNAKRLAEAHSVFSRLDENVLRRLRKRLRVGSDFNFNSGKQLGDILKKRRKLDAYVMTASGDQLSTKIDVLRKTCNDKTLLNLLSVHSVAEKYIGTFLVPWIEQSEFTGGRVLPSFNQTRGRDQDFGGARSGRYSSSKPNMQTVTANVDESKNKEVLQLMQKMLLQEQNYRFIGLRDFFIPDEGMVMICVDYDQQELRILAHFERGELMRAYLKNPNLDVHEYVRQDIYKRTGILYERKAIKTVVFGCIYGMGIGKLALQLEESPKVADQIREGVYSAVPGIPRMVKKLKRLARRDEPLITYGGRQYYCEEPRYDKEHKRWMTYEYKMLNYKIQPSAADVTKQGMLNVHDDVPEVRIALQVHDELMTMAPSEKYGPRIARAMCDMKFRVPMTATYKTTRKSWARVA
jgi:DNA polymerase-1